MATLPTSLALTSIADGALAVAADHRNNFAAIQAEANALLTILAAGATGQVLTSGGGTTVAWGPTYSAYTPLWTSSGVAPAFGNASVTAHYTQLGKFVHAWGRIVFGGTSTFGTGTYTMGGLPAPIISGMGALGSVTMYDSSANVWVMGNASASTSTAFSLEHAATYMGLDAVAAATVPWTWAVNDQINWNITYEAA